MIKLAIFASGGGSNAENIIRYFNKHDTIRVAVVLTNNKNAGVIERCRNTGTSFEVFQKDDLNDDTIVKILAKYEVDYLILAGFLLKIPGSIIERYENKILNIHPSLLPNYGGKGMYGHHVHDAVIAAGDTFSGITIHLVNTNYDEGQVVFQEKVPVLENDSSESLAARIHKTEHMHFPRVIEEFISPVT